MLRAIDNVQLLVASAEQPRIQESSCQYQLLTRAIRHIPPLPYPNRGALLTSNRRRMWISLAKKQRTPMVVLRRNSSRGTDSTLNFSATPQLKRRAFLMNLHPASKSYSSSESAPRPL